MVSTTSDAFTHVGKQILRGGQHFADAATPEIAKQVVSALSDRASIAAYLDEEAGNPRRTRYVRHLIGVLADNVRAGRDVGEGVDG